MIVKLLEKGTKKIREFHPVDAYELLKKHPDLYEKASQEQLNESRTLITARDLVAPEPELPGKGKGRKK